MREQRFVAAPAPSTDPGRRPGLHPQDAPRQAGCHLLTSDTAHADLVALIAAAAGVELTVHTDASTLPGIGADAVLLVAVDALDAFSGAAETAGDGAWGATAGGRAALGSGAGGVVLTGAAGEQDRLWRAAAVRPGARVAVLPEASAWLGEYLGALATTGGQGRVSLFLGASGGAGTTTVAALTAAAAARAGYSTVLVDADAAGAGLWPVLDPGPLEGLTWEDTVGSHGRIPPQQLLETLPAVDGLRIMTSLGGSSAVPLGLLQAGASGPSPSAGAPTAPSGRTGRAEASGPPAPRQASRPGAVLREVLAAAARAFEVVVVDGGRGVPPQAAALAHTVFHVVPAQRAAQLDLAAGRLAAGGGHAFAVVTGRLPTGADSPSVARHAGLPLAGHLPPVAAVRRAGVEGRLLDAAARRRVSRRLDRVLFLCSPLETGDQRPVDAAAPATDGAALDREAAPMAASGPGAMR